MGINAHPSPGGSWGLATGWQRCRSEPGAKRRGERDCVEQRLSAAAAHVSAPRPRVMTTRPARRRRGRCRRDRRALRRCGACSRSPCTIAGHRPRSRHGRAVEGVCGLMDEAMVALTAGELSPIVSGLVYCGVITGLSRRRAYELRRAQRVDRGPDARWCDEAAGHGQLHQARAWCIAPRSCSCRGPGPEALEGGAARGWRAARRP